MSKKQKSPSKRSKKAKNIERLIDVFNPDDFKLKPSDSYKSNAVDLKKIPTCELTKELETRIGVIEYTVEPYVDYSLKIGEKVYKDNGPASILVVID